MFYTLREKLQVALTNNFNNQQSSVSLCYRVRRMDVFQRSTLAFEARGVPGLTHPLSLSVTNNTSDIDNIPSSKH